MFLNSWTYSNLVDCWELWIAEPSSFVPNREMPDCPDHHRWNCVVSPSQSHSEGAMTMSSLFAVIVPSQTSSGNWDGTGPAFGYAGLGGTISPLVMPPVGDAEPA